MPTAGVAVGHADAPDGTQLTDEQEAAFQRQLRLIELDEAHKAVESIEAKMVGWEASLAAARERLEAAKAAVEEG